MKNNFEQKYIGKEQGTTGEGKGKISRREFIKKAGRIGAGLAAVTATNSIPGKLLAETKIDKEQENIENAFRNTLEILEMANNLVLEGKRIKLEPVKHRLDKLASICRQKNLSYTNLVENIATEYMGYSVDQVAELLNRYYHLLEAIDQHRTHFEEYIHNLEDLRVGHIRPFSEIIQMAQLYAISNKRGARAEYGLGFIKRIKNNPEDLVEITQSLSGEKTSVNLQSREEMGASPTEYEKYLLHTHPDKFSFFSIRGDFTYYLSKANKAKELSNFIPLMVDGSGIVWQMKFNGMNDEQLLNLKKQDKFIDIFLSKHYSNLMAVIVALFGREINLRQAILEEEFSTLVNNTIDIILDMGSDKELKTEMQKLQKDLRELQPNITDLKKLNKVALKILGSEKQNDFQRAVAEAKKEFKKHGVEVHAKIPGRVIKEWEKAGK